MKTIRLPRLGKARQPLERPARKSDLKILALKSVVKPAGGNARRLVSFAVVLLALMALVCLLTVQPRISVGTGDLNAASAQQPIELAEVAVDELPDPAMASSTLTGNDTPTEESFQAIPAIEGSWARELRELKALAAQDPEAALERISQMPVAEEREVALKEVCLEFAGEDPAWAMQVAWHFQLGRLGGPAENATLEDLASRWAAADLNAALVWAVQQPVDEAGQRDRIVKGIASAWSQRAPADAAQLVAEHMSPGYTQFDAAMKLVGRWAGVDVSAATAWVNLFPNGPVQDRAREELLKAVATRQPLSISPN